MNENENEPGEEASNETVTDLPVGDNRLAVGGKTLASRLIVGTGRYDTMRQMRASIDASGADCVTVAVRRGDAPVLTATFAGQHRPLDDASLARAFWSHPLLTWKVIAAIHWEAIKLLFKGARYRVRGTPPGNPVTHGTAL
jgi:hypothetical protein